MKKEVEKLSKKDLEKLVLKAASMNRQFRDYLLINFIDRELGESDLFEAARADLKVLCGKNYKGRSDEMRSANMLVACNKRIGVFSKVCKDKSLEMDLIMDVLKSAFLPSRGFLGTCFTKFDYQVYLLVKKAITLLEDKLHEDYYIQYAADINKYLKLLHDRSRHLNYVYAMPKTV